MLTDAPFYTHDASGVTIPFPGGRTAFLQGEDAARFFEDAEPAADAGTLTAFLWEYEKVAE